jgi:hypothetical protein
VKAIYASATLNNEIATINWNTQGEEEVVTYTVEKSTDAKVFNKIGEVVVAKNSSTASYNAEDKNIVNSNTFYRIKATNLDATVQYSNIAKLNTNNLELNNYSIYPNPAKDWFKVILPTKYIYKGVYTINILSVEGKQLLHKTNIKITNGNELMVTNVDLLDGIYIIKIFNESGEIITSKLRIAH